LEERRIYFSGSKRYTVVKITVKTWKVFLERRLAMEGILYVLALFVLRLGVPALVLLTLGEVVHRRSSHNIVGGD
jgi:hypothetical protein